MAEDYHQQAGAVGMCTLLVGQRKCWAITGLIVSGGQPFGSCANGMGHDAASIAADHADCCNQYFSIMLM
jgi:hypothetical protein